MPAPPLSVIRAFAAADLVPDRVAGGQRTVWLAGDVVLKPLDMPAEQLAWQAQVRAVMQSFAAGADRGRDDEVRQLPVPVIVIHGSHDVPARARPVAEAAPAGQWVQLEHSAHVRWLEELKVLREVLREFVTQLNE